MKTFKVCPGIGDNIWLLQKLVNTKEQFIFEIGDGFPQRGKQVFDLLPSIAIDSSYVPNLPYIAIKKGNVQFEYRNWKDIAAWSKRYGDKMFLSCNDWLEKGNRLADFLPDLPLTYHLPWETSYQDQLEIEQDFPLEHLTDTKLVGIYASAYGTERAWKEYGAWSAAEWVELITSLWHERPATIFVMIGADWDNDMADDIQRQLRERRIPHLSTVGKTLGYVIELMKRLTYGIYFPSGLPIMSESIEGAHDCLMLYGSNLTALMGTWADPERIKNKQFKEQLFVRPVKVYEWLRDEYKLFDKL